MPAAAAGAVVATSLQQSIFNNPAAASSLPVPPLTGNLKPLTSTNQTLADAASPTPSGAGQKRRREEEDEEEDDSDGDVAMDEDSDDD